MQFSWKQNLRTPPCCLFPTRAMFFDTIKPIATDTQCSTLHQACIGTTDSEVDTRSGSVCTKRRHCAQNSPSKEQPQHSKRENTFLQLIRFRKGCHLTVRFGLMLLRFSDLLGMSTQTPTNCVIFAIITNSSC